MTVGDSNTVSPIGISCPSLTVASDIFAFPSSIKGDLKLIGFHLGLLVPQQVGESNFLCQLLYVQQLGTRCRVELRL